MAIYTSPNNYIYFKDTSDGHLWTRITYTLTEDTVANTYTITLVNFGLSINGWMNEWHYGSGDFVINGQTIAHSGSTVVFTGIAKDDGASFTDKSASGYFSPLTIGPFSYSQYPTITAKQTDRYIVGFGTVAGNPHRNDIVGTNKSGGAITVPHAHSHSYGFSVTKQPTCGTAGIRTYTCECGSSYTEAIAATGNHSYMPATCTTPQTCSVCGQTAGSAFGHNWDNGTVTTEPTYTIDGVMTYCCIREGCGTTKTEIIQRLGMGKRFVPTVFIQGEEYIPYTYESSTWCLCHSLIHNGTTFEEY